MKSPKAPDTSKQDAILAKQEAEEQSNLAQREEASKRKRKGRRSLLYAGGDESGVANKPLSETLGG
jgi:hypothetical protein